MTAPRLIRPLHTADRSGWQAMYRAYHAFYDRPDLPASFFDEAFARLMSGEAADFRGLVAEEDGELLGVTHFVIHPNLWRPEGVCYLQDLFTTPAARGQGVAQALIIAVGTAAAEAGVTTVYWFTAEDNYPARTLYDRVARKSRFLRYDRV